MNTLATGANTVYNKQNIANSNFTPAVDNTFTLGDSLHRWVSVYARSFMEMIDNTNNNVIGVATIILNAVNGQYAIITATNVAANITIGAPTNLNSGQRYTIVIKNSSGGAIAGLTWTNAIFKFVGGAAPAAPANGTQSKVEFLYDGTNLTEISRSVAVAN